MNNEAGDHKITLRAKDEDTIRIRLDLIQFMLPKDALTNPRVTDCRQNRMMISRIDASDATVNIGALCGNNNGQHVYIHLPDDRAERGGWSSTISFDFGGAKQYGYNIMVTQLDESRSIDRPLIDLRSGPGCH